MAIQVPEIVLKYITLFSNMEGYNAAKGEFIEVNWSAVKDAEHPEEVETEYQPSTRNTHGFEPVDNVDVLPDSSVRMKYYTYDHILKTFFLEIIWGYSGWEWKDYEYNGQTLKGGNLYKVKEITEVPSIPDGYRLYHINNFLNSQDKVTHVCWFDTSNIVSMQSAFERSLYSSVQARLDLDCYDFPNVENIVKTFKNRELRIIDNHTLYLGKVKKVYDDSIDTSAFYGIQLVASNILSINMPELIDANYLFPDVIVPSNITEFNINSIFIGDTLNNTALFGSAFWNLRSRVDSGTFTVKLDLTNTNISNSTTFDLTSVLYSVRGANNTVISIFDLKINNPVILDQVLAGNTYPCTLTINNPNLITSIKKGFYNRTWNNNHLFPYNQPINENVDDTEEFSACYFYCDVDYDFSPNHTLKLSYGHFDDARFESGTHIFRNMEYLNRVVFRPRTGFTNLPNTLWSQNIQYEFPSERIKNDYMGDSRFKVIQIGGSITTIAAQTLYCLNAEPFTGNIQLNENVIVHCCQESMEGNQYSSFSLSNNVMTKSPTIYVHCINAENEYLHRAKISVKGSLLEEINIHIVDETGQSGTRWLNIYLDAQIPNLQKIVIDSDFYDNSSWNISNSPNIIMSDFETLVMHRMKGTVSSGSSQGYLKLLTSQWAALNSTCKDHCFEIFNYIDQVAE